jgi:hypothetical protein
VKLRELLRKMRLRSLQGEGERPVDNVDAMATAPEARADNIGGFGDSAAPTNWVPSQQDDRPRH